MTLTTRLDAMVSMRDSMPHVREIELNTIIEREYRLTDALGVFCRKLLLASGHKNIMLNILHDFMWSILVTLWDGEYLTRARELFEVYPGGRSKGMGVGGIAADSQMKNALEMIKSLKAEVLRLKKAAGTKSNIESSRTEDAVADSLNEDELRALGLFIEKSRQGSPRALDRTEEILIVGAELVDENEGSQVSLREDNVMTDPDHQLEDRLAALLRENEFLKSELLRFQHKSSSSSLVTSTTSSLVLEPTHKPFTVEHYITDDIARKVLSLGLGATTKVELVTNRSSAAISAVFPGGRADTGDSSVTAEELVVKEVLLMRQRETEDELRINELLKELIEKDEVIKTLSGELERIIPAARAYHPTTEQSTNNTPSKTGVTTQVVTAAQINPSSIIPSPSSVPASIPAALHLPPFITIHSPSVSRSLKPALSMEVTDACLVNAITTHDEGNMFAASQQDEAVEVEIIEMTSEEGSERQPPPRHVKIDWWTKKGSSDAQPIVIQRSNYQHQPISHSSFSFEEQTAADEQSMDHKTVVSSHNNVVRSYQTQTLAAPSSSVSASSSQLFIPSSNPINQSFTPSMTSSSNTQPSQVVTGGTEPISANPKTITSDPNPAMSESMIAIVTSSVQTSSSPSNTANQSAGIATTSNQSQANNTTFAAVSSHNDQSDFAPLTASTKQHSPHTFTPPAVAPSSIPGTNTITPAPGAMIPSVERSSNTFFTPSFAAPTAVTNTFISPTGTLTNSPISSCHSVEPSFVPPTHPIASASSFHNRLQNYSEVPVMQTAPRTDNSTDSLVLVSRADSLATPFDDETVTPVPEAGLVLPPGSVPLQYSEPLSLQRESSSSPQYMPSSPQYIQPYSSPQQVAPSSSHISRRNSVSVASAVVQDRLDEINVLRAEMTRLQGILALVEKERKEIHDRYHNLRVSKSELDCVYEPVEVVTEAEGTGNTDIEGYIEEKKDGLAIPPTKKRPSFAADKSTQVNVVSNSARKLFAAPNTIAPDVEALLNVEREKTKKAMEETQMARSCLNELERQLATLQQLLRNSGVKEEQINSAMNKSGLTKLLESSRVGVFERLYRDAVERMVKMNKIRQLVHEIESKELERKLIGINSNPSLQYSTETTTPFLHHDRILRNSSGHAQPHKYLGGGYQANWNGSIFLYFNRGRYHSAEPTVNRTFTIPSPLTFPVLRRNQH